MMTYSLHQLLVMINKKCSSYRGQVGDSQTRKAHGRGHTGMCYDAAK
jgi:hypothetical protein